MAITAADFMEYRGRLGASVTPVGATAASAALAKVDQAANLAAAKAAYTVQMWDGTGDPPVGTRDRWLHGNDAISRAAIANFAAGKVAYFLLKDGQLYHWQPFGPYGAGPMSADPADPDHWQKHADTHIATEAGRDADLVTLRQALAAAG